MPFNLKLNIEATTRKQTINNGYKDAKRTAKFSNEVRIDIYI